MICLKTSLFSLQCEWGPASHSTEVPTVQQSSSLPVTLANCFLEIRTDLKVFVSHITIYVHIFYQRESRRALLQPLAHHSHRRTRGACLLWVCPTVELHFACFFLPWHPQQDVFSVSFHLSVSYYPAFLFCSSETCSHQTWGNHTWVLFPYYIYVIFKSRGYYPLLSWYFKTSGFIILCRGKAELIFLIQIPSCSV